jgi:hypothetical protein
MIEDAQSLSESDYRISPVHETMMLPRGSAQRSVTPTLQPSNHGSGMLFRVHTPPKERSSSSIMGGFQKP